MPIFSQKLFFKQHFILAEGSLICCRNVTSVHSIVGCICTGILVWFRSMLLNRLSQLCHHPTLWDVSQRGLATHQLLSRRMRSERQVWLPSPWPVVQCHPQSPHVPAQHTLGQQHDHPLKASLGGAAALLSHYFTRRIEKKLAPSCCHHHSNNNNNNDDDDVSQQEGL